MRRLLVLLPMLAAIVALAPRPGWELGGPTGDILTGTGTVVAQGQFAYRFTYQGQLRQNGAPYSGSCSMQFRIFAGVTGGPSLFEETIANVPVTNGLFSVTVGATASIPQNLFRGDPRFLDVTACGQQLSPRQPLTGVPYAFWAPHAGTAEQVSGQFAGDVTGTQGATTVARLHGKPVSATAPIANQALVFDGTSWAPAALGPRVVAAGIVKADGTRRAPVFGNVRIIAAGALSAVAESEVDVAFDGYLAPTATRTYLVKVTPFFNTVANSQLVFNVRDFTLAAIRLTVRDGAGARLTEPDVLAASEMMIEITAITAQP